MSFLAGIITFLGCRLLLAIAISGGVLWLFFGNVFAAPRYLVDEAPEIIIPVDGIAFRNVVQSGDLLVIWRYNLPAGFDESGDPQNWQVHGTEAALMRLIQGSPPAEQERPPRRLGNALGGFYLLPGHDAQWGSGDLVIRMQGNPGLFIDVKESNRPIDFSHAGADSATLVSASDTRRGALCNVFQNFLQAIEQADPALSSGDLVSSNVATTDGTLMALDAFSAATALLPECFAVGVTGSGQSFNPTTPGAGRDELVDDVEATDMWQTWAANFSTNAQAVLAATALAVVASFITMGVLTPLTKSVAFGVAAGVALMLGLALLVPHTLFQVVMVVIALATVLALAWIWQRLPRG